MPELPEVETVARRIAPLVTGHRIEAVGVFWERTLGGASRRSFQRSLTGAVITRVSRRAKYIFLELDSGAHLSVHLRMSGDLVVMPQSAAREKHLRVSLSLSDGMELRFVDTRKFGRFVYHTQIQELLNRLGPEPIDADFDFAAFHERLRMTRRAIKPLLLDQAVVAGLGNIYVVESLWRARVHPLTRADTLSRKKTETLMRAAAEVLQEAIATHGTDLGDGVWKTGGFSPSTYGREGQPCLRCGTVLSKIRVAQRGTEFCPRCQRMSEEK